MDMTAALSNSGPPLPAPGAFLPSPCECATRPEGFTASREISRPARAFDPPGSGRIIRRYRIEHANVKEKSMPKHKHAPAAVLLALAAALGTAAPAAGQSAETVKKVNQWPVHDESRPRPPVVTPATASTQERPGQPPSDAVVLFDGKDASGWQSEKGEPLKWKVENGYLEVVKGAGSAVTKQTFGDVQLHVEWASPTEIVGESQGRGNSGIFLMGIYEVQVLDSYNNVSYADGQASAIYGQYPPLVNAARPPGQWQTYEIIFRRPRFDKDGKVLRPAYITVLHNGVLTQDHAEVTGPTTWKQRPPYKAHADKLPISLQDHGNPVRYRNIWLRELPEE
jgi:hypothetical protein